MIKLVLDPYMLVLRSFCVMIKSSQNFLFLKKAMPLRAEKVSLLKENGNGSLLVTSRLTHLSTGEREKCIWHTCLYQTTYSMQAVPGEIMWSTQIILALKVISRKEVTERTKNGCKKF